MDPTTVVTLLALNFICVGGLLLLIARRMADAAGLRAFAWGALFFGGGYLLRLALGFSTGRATGVLPDTAMVLATLLFANGVREFSGQAALGTRPLAMAAATYALLALAATALWGGVGRHAVLNLALAGGYLLVGALAALGLRHLGRPLWAPLRILSVLMALIGLATAARAVAAMALGLEPLFSGPWAQAYYSVSLVVIMLLGPNLLWMVFVRLNTRLNDLATHDALTGVLNRRGLEEAVQRHFGQRPPAPLRLLLVDVDHFKRINDGHGHAVGDAVLQSLARTLAGQLRAGDLLARWGGEEFLVVCPETDLGAALALGERLRLAVDAAPHGAAPPLACTVSIGVSHAAEAAAAWEAALRSADEALYTAKAQGRNLVRNTAQAPTGAA